MADKEVLLKHLDEQVWAMLRSRLPDIERVAEHGVTRGDDLDLVRRVFWAAAGHIRKSNLEVQT